ncbi:MAG: aminoacyl-tRNA hydrolase [Parcubacteria group bacterium GW2011_GWA2_38_13b]|nr:MAG: aminoacyl-tRNA hydrolase [Parcubacteria group bacterium GW2011_GWA2_38_13b]
MLLIAGLGNSSIKYNNTRHNVGFKTIDQIQENWKTIYNFSEWKLSPKFNGELSEGKIAKTKIILVKPTTYMNNSGIAVKKIVEFNKIPYGDVFIIHDDFDLPFGKIKKSYGRGSAGHKGAESIITTLKTKNFTRIRIGINPADKKLPLKSLDSFVLAQFTENEKKEIPNIIKKAISLIDQIACGKR